MNEQLCGGLQESVRDASRRARRMGPVISRYLWKQTTFRKYFTIGRFRVDSTLGEAAQVPAKAPSGRAFVYVFGAVALGVAAMIAWSVVDDGVDTQVRLAGQVVKCSRGGLRRQTSCAVRLAAGDVVQVYMQSRQPGLRVQLMQLRRPISGDLYYMPAHST